MQVEADWWAKVGKKLVLVIRIELNFGDWVPIVVEYWI